MTPLKSFARWLFGRALPKRPYRILRGPLRGYRFILGAAAGEAGGVSIHFGRVEVEQSETLTRLLQSGQVFFDVGANVGYYSLLASKCVGPRGHVVAFEPVPRNISFLHQHITLNNLSNVTILPVACSDQLSLEGFTAGKNHSVGHLVQESDLNSTPDKCGLVFTVTLDEIVTRKELRPNVIKIDAEGAEYRVLQGGKATLTEAKPRVLLSIHSDALRIQCIEYLEGFGYRTQPLDSASIATATELLFEP